MGKIEKRTYKYRYLSKILESLNPQSLVDLLESSPVTLGWGINHVLELNQHKVFLKRIPLTQLELEHQNSTKNLFDLPLFYQYGVGSAGFGAFRELHLNLKTTQWVLNKEIQSFPLLYHHRIVKKDDRCDHELKKKTQSYFDYWNNDKNIKTYVKAREDSDHELLLFLEYFPYTLKDWIGKHQVLLNHLTAQMRNTTNFLWDKKILHMDAHFSNIMSDGQDFYLTDFGLALDQSFDLGKDESIFLQNHKGYDFNEYLLCLSGLLLNSYSKLNESSKLFIKKEIGDFNDSSQNEVLFILLTHVDNSRVFQRLGLDNTLVHVLKDNHRVILNMAKFFNDLRNDFGKRVKYNMP